MFASLLIIVVQNGICYGVSDYENPNFLVAFANSFYDSIRNSCTGEIFGSTLYPTLGTALNSILISNGTIASPNIETNQIAGIAVSFGISFIVIFLLYIVLLFGFFVWIFGQCCQCCCCPGQEPVCNCCCWTKSGPKKCCKICTKITFAILTVLSAFFVIVLAIAFFELPAKFNSVPESFQNVDNLFSGVKSVVTDVSALPDDISTTVKSLLKAVIDNLPLQAADSVISTVNTSIYEISNCATDLSDAITDIDKLLMDGLHSNLQAIDEVFINIECDFNSTPPTCFNQTTALLNLTEQHAVAEIKRILDEKQSNDVDGVIGNIQTKADVLGTTVSEDVQQLTDAINTLKDGLNNFFEKIANITDYDITTYLGDITSQLDAAINSNIKPDNISAMTESLSNLNNLTSIVDKEIELVQEKLFCSGVDGYTGLPYLSDLSSHTAHCQKVANLTKELYSFVSGEPTFHKLIVTLQEVTAGHGNETQTLMVAAEGLEEIHTNIDNCGLDSFATLSSSFLNDLPLENITAPVDYAKNAVNGLEEQANDMISTLDSTLKGKLSSLSEMNNPLGGVEEKYNTAAEPVIKYVGAGSYAMAAMFVLLVVLYVVQLLFTFCCPKQCCLCCCQCVDFAYFLIFGLVILLFGILGCLLREASRFVYGGEFLQFAKQSGLMEQVAEMLPLSSLDMQPVAVLGTTIDLKSIIDLDAAKLYGIMEFYWVANSEAENPLATIVSKLKDTINSLIDGIADIESTGIVPSNIKLGTETKRIVSTGASAVKNHTDGAFDSVSQLIAPDSISKTMFSALDVVFLALTNVMILFWLCSFWLSMFVILHVCCLGSGRTYWPPYKAPKGGEKEEDGDEDEESENEGNSNENGEDDGLTEHERRKKRRKERRERKKLQEMQMLSMQLGIAPQVATGIGMGMGMGAGMEMGMGMGSGMGMGIGMGAFDNPAEVYPVQGQMVMPSPNAQPMAAFPSEQMMPGNGMFMSEYT